MSIIDRMQNVPSIPQHEIDRKHREADAAGRRWERQLTPEEQRQRRAEASQATFEQRQAERAKQVAAWEEADRKEREEREAAREADRVERTKADERELKARMRAAYMETPGATEAGFARVWPQLMEQHQVAQTLAAVPIHERLVAEFKAMRGSGPDFYEKPLPQPIED
jgi:hypothetical protein